MNLISCLSLSIYPGYGVNPAQPCYCVIIFTLVFKKVLIFDPMRNLLPLSRCPDAHVHLLIVKVNMNEAIVSLGKADEVVVVAAGHAGVGECLLGQLLLRWCTVAPECWYMMAGKIYQDWAPGNPLVVNSGAVIVGDIVVDERELTVLVVWTPAMVVSTPVTQSVGVHEEAWPVLWYSTSSHLIQDLRGTPCLGFRHSLHHQLCPVRVSRYKDYQLNKEIWTSRAEILFFMFYSIHNAESCFVLW